MASSKWRGYAEFDTAGDEEAIMTVCPGNPDQEGSRFNAILEAAAQKLGHLYIIQAGDLGFHNLKRVVPQNEARTFANVRGQKWQTTHQPAIDRHMPDRCEVIPMADIVSDPSYKNRVELIRQIHARGNNSVTAWFNDSANYNNPAKSKRWSEKGVLIEEWALKQDSLDYLCNEYAMRSLMWKRFGLKEIYLGRAVSDPKLFQHENIERPEIDLTIPAVCPITLQQVEMVHNRRRGRSFPTETVPSYAENVHGAGQGPSRKMG